ncbi:ATP synthase subunit C lysine N-methyltransferase-like isoform X2 [Artemia franciscana]|uniref:ATP synthase subunit C lysine N-methyltransferase-like isoform X2 n=1 Tax=Artemia franciscana TaxID=6661 RepID=UPI0032DB9A8F
MYYEMKTMAQTECTSCNDLRNQLGLKEEDINSIQKINSRGLILAACFGGAALGISFVCIPFVLPGFRKYCLPYVPASNEQVTNVLKGLKFCDRSKRLLDIGSGDGRIVIAAAREGFNSDGIELNTVLVYYSRYSALKNGLKARFFKRDLWKFDCSPYGNIVIFGVEQMMAPLEEKFTRELVRGTKIIACRFPLPNLTPIHTIGSGIDAVWLYEV